MIVAMIPQHHIESAIEAEAKDAIASMVFALIETLYDAKCSAPESYIQMGLKLSLHHWTVLRDEMVRGGLLTISNHLVSLGTEGLALGQRMEKAKVARRREANAANN